MGEAMNKNNRGKRSRRGLRSKSSKPTIASSRRLVVESLEQRVVPSSLPQGLFPPGFAALQHLPTPAGIPIANGNHSTTFIPGAFPSPAITLGTSFDGLHYTDQPCGCLPPDSGLGVGNGFVVQAVNASEIRISDMSGNPLLTKDFSQFLGQSAHGNGGDIFVAFDDIANRWYFGQLDGAYTGYEFAASRDANPMDGFASSTFISLGHLLDFPKIGFNADDVVITGDVFGTGTYPVEVIAIDKSALLGGTFKDYIHDLTGYPTNWGLMPAKMHGSAPGDPQYFVDEAGFGNGHAIRVFSGTNLLSNSPTFTSTDIGVNTYGEPVSAVQPGGSSVATNSAWEISADWRNNILATAHNATTPGDGGTTTHAIWYEVSTSGTPSLMDQGVISSAVGVHSYMPSAAVNANGDIGITYMESSLSEFISMYVGVHAAGSAAGSTSTTLAKAGTDTMANSSRSGDYSTTVVDPSNPNTFWATNEYSPPNSGTDIWATYIASFTSVSVPTADLSVKLTGKSRAKEGGMVTYTLTVFNAGPDAATNTVLTDTLGALLNFVSATSSQGTFSQSAGVVTFSIGTIASGGTVTATVTAQATEDGTNTDAAVVAADQFDPTPGDNSASKTTIFSEPPITVSAPITTTSTTLTNFKVATFRHASGVEPISAFTATIDWGDGTTSIGTIVLSNKTYKVFGSHTYNPGGTHTITTRVVENGTPPNSPAEVLASLLLTKQSSGQPAILGAGASIRGSDNAVALDLYFNSSASGVGEQALLSGSSSFVAASRLLPDFGGLLGDDLGDLSSVLGSIPSTL